MVKILQAYNFAKQNTFALNGEILAATLIDSNRIAISSAEQFIEIYDIVDRQRLGDEKDVGTSGVGESVGTNDNLVASNTTSVNDEKLPTKYTLATVGEVVNLIYCEAGKYLVTLEKENVGSPVHTNSSSISCTSSSNNTTVYSEDDTKMFVRIYANFLKFPESKLVDLPITIRIASMTTPKAQLVKSIDVIELPLRSPPDLIQCCQTSGNIIVSSKERIYLYEYTQCVHESTQPRFKYIDFLPFKFFVNLNFVPLKLSLAENVIACMNNRYCVAFRVVDVLASNVCTTGDGGIQNNMPFTYDLDDNADIEIDDISNSESSMASKTSVGPSSHSHNSFETDSLETTASGRPLNGFPGRTPIDFNLARMVNSACGREFEVDIKSQWEQKESDNNAGGKCNITCDTQEIIITPTKANEIKIKLVNEAKAMNVQRISSNGKIISAYNEENMVQYDIRKLLQICMKTSEPGGGRVVDILRCMDLKAIYQRNDNDSDNIEDPEYDMGNQQIPGAITTSKHVNRRTLKSNKHQSCIGFALLVASSVDGYLYQFCAQGKWYNENEKPIATYSFTAPVLQVHINDYVIYAVTTESVETHTSRIGHKLFNNRFEYPSIAELFPEESNPDVNAPIAVVGLCSFMHVQYVCVNRNNLVLISNGALNPGNNSTTGDTALKRRSTGEGKRNIAARLIAEAKAKHNQLRNSYSNQQSVTNEWTLYNLEVPLVEQVVDDLETIAETYRSASGSNFYDLMEEAHVMLRMSTSLQFDKLSEERETKLRLKFMANCRKLADFSIRSKKKEIHMQASGFYKMCNLQLSEIYENYINNYLYIDEEKYEDVQKLPTPGDDSTIEPEQLHGLIYTVKLFLIYLGTDRLKASFLNQLVKPFFTPSRVVKQGFSQVSLSLEFLNLFIKYSPEDIPSVMLGSPVVADSISGEIINYLKFLDNLNADDNLLLAVTACRMSNYILSQEVISRTYRRDLAVALIKYKNVLFDDTTLLYQKQKRNKTDGYPNGSAKDTPTANSKQGKLKLVQSNQNAMVGHVSTSCQEVVSFSDFTETILLATEKTELIEAISDVFIHALCVEHSITLDIILQLFLNYIASHIGQKGYQTSQKVFVNILQVYYYDLFDVIPINSNQDIPTNNTPPQIDEDYDEGFSKGNSDRDSESIANSIGDTNSAASSSIDDRRISNHCNRIIYDQLQEQQSPFKRSSNASLLNIDDQHHNNIDENENNNKGLKILFRMYMGRLRALSDLITDLQSADLEQQSLNEEFLSLRMECITFMMRHLQELRMQQQHNNQLGPNQTHQLLYYGKSLQVNGARISDQKMNFVPFIPDYKLNGEKFDQHIKSYVRPIPCLLDRPQYLNRLPPFKRGDFSYPNKEEGETEVHFVGWHNELLTLTLKIQSLLASPKIDQEIIEEFIAFVQKTPNLIGIDSFLVIVLPKQLAINYMLNFCPEFLWQYGKSNNFTPKQWELLLKKILSKKELLPNWKTYVTEILNNLVADLNFEELLQCFPNEVIQNRNIELWTKEFNTECITAIDANIGGLIFEQENNENTVLLTQTITRDHLPMDNVDENNVFELTLRKAVSKQRSIALRSMIESTGKQLFEATSNPMYNL
ncbi:uncharacterized protein ACRADG_001377 isoform 1-T4 [Cochliomyia hominivorax]